MDDFFDPVYRGAMTPPSFAGIPMIPFIMGTVASAQLAVLGMAFWGLAGLAPVAIAYLAAFRWARTVGRHDEQRILQYLLMVRLRRGQRAARAAFGVVSYSPGRETGRR